MMKSKTILLSLLLIFPLLLQAAPSQKSNSHCLRCHGMQTLSYLDSTTNAIVSLYVDSTQFKHSNHSKLQCTYCHKDAGFLTYPHPKALQAQHLYCTDCHQEKEFARFQFKKREQEFKRSVHHQKLGDKFTCFSCHDPHQFKTTYGEENFKDIVRRDNAICLTCHKTGHQLIGMIGKAPYKDLLSVHSWLPNPQLHWKAVRCIECHTNSPGDLYPHQILPKEQAVKKCEECHSKNSILYSKLYRFKAKQIQQKKGLLQMAVQKYPYAVGMARNQLIDNLSILIFVLMLIGLATHGFLRWLSGRKRS